MQVENQTLTPVLVDPQTGFLRPDLFKMSLPDLIVRLDHLAYAYVGGSRLPLHKNTVYNLIIEWNAYRRDWNTLSPEVIAEQTKAVRLVVYFFEQLAADNPLLIPDNYEVVLRSGFAKLSHSLMKGIMELNTDAMLPTYDRNTLVHYYEWPAKKMASSYGYSLCYYHRPL